MMCLKLKRYIVVAYYSFKTSIVFLTNSFAATTGTNTRNTTFKIVHSDLLNKTWNMKYENVIIEVSHNSMFKNLYSISMFINR